MRSIDDAAFHLMRRALQEHGARWQSALPRLTKPQYAVLVAVAEHETTDQAGAGERAAIDKATLATLLQRLEERGLIAREVGADRRRRLVRLTEAGDEALRAARPAADEVDEAMLSRLTARERAQLHGLLAKLAGA